MKTSRIIMNVVVLIFCSYGKAFAHEMQHGFILSENDTFASHLVANGHHSRQVEIMVQLDIPETSEKVHYQERKRMSPSEQTYFLFQAQHLNLPGLTAGTLLVGHIVESKIGNYEPKNVIVKSATLRVQKVLLNVTNPFFGD